MSRLDAVKLWLGTNWQLMAAKLVLLGVWTGAFYFYGVHTEREEWLKKDANIGREVVQQVQERLPVVAARDNQVAEQKARIENLQEQYNELVEKSTNSPDCSLSDDELRILQELAK